MQPEEPEQSCWECADNINIFFSPHDGHSSLPGIAFCTEWKIVAFEGMTGRGILYQRYKIQGTASHLFQVVGGEIWY
jgi:hypothetical protein